MDLKNSPQFVKTEDVLIFGASHSILIRHEKPFCQQSDFQGKLSDFDNIPINKTPLSRKKREKIFNTGGIRQRDRFSARGQGVGVYPGKKARCRMKKVLRIETRHTPLNSELNFP